MPVRCNRRKKSLTQWLKNSPSYSSSHDPPPDMMTSTNYLKSSTLPQKDVLHKNINVKRFHKCIEGVCNLNHRNIYLIASISSRHYLHCLAIPNKYHIILKILKFIFLSWNITFVNQWDQQTRWQPKLIQSQSWNLAKTYWM